MVVYKNSRSRPYYLRRCKRVRPTNIESLPSELLSDILVRLPADHLYDRVRLACRRWYHIIHSYDFVDTQIQHSTYGLLLYCICVWGGHHPILITATQGGRIETSEYTYLYRGKLINCCNGLCIEAYCRSGYPYIINPSTKQSFIIPSLPQTPYRLDLFGMVFAPRSMKYKLTSPFWKFKQIHLGILTFGVDNSWRHACCD
ncbi:putative F-box protein At3g52320 [Salvia miltiorrhiza]|uniref:putative F-box protein At3g52320 n=1 Tax=Salvia miltiorrhiza TaxID=226208 RepID=UPI0025AC24FD|nr:putative F-box protein At3g52320 [Salvia miltiorrhiza]